MAANSVSPDLGSCHCEERSDEAIPNTLRRLLRYARNDGFRMTHRYRLTFGKRACSDQYQT